MAYILRHHPEEFGVDPDPEGFTSLIELLGAVRTRFPSATLEDLRSVVTSVEPDNQRFTIVDGDIRANYGHSLKDKIVHPTGVPPPILYHGTAEAFVRAILKSGLKPMRRQYVHLTENQALAQRVGSRHGKPRVLTIDAASAHRDGVFFYRPNPAFWLVEEVGAKYIVA